MNPLESQTPNRRRTLLIIAGLVIIVGSMAGGVAVMNDPAADPAAAAAAAQQQMPPMPVDVATAKQESVVDAVKATGRIEAVQAVELRADEAGRITQLLFREGQFVEAGTPLIRIDDALLK